MDINIEVLQIKHLHGKSEEKESLIASYNFPITNKRKAMLQNIKISCYKPLQRKLNFNKLKAQKTYSEPV